MANPTELITAYPSAKGLLTGRKGNLYTGPRTPPSTIGYKPTTQLMANGNQGTPKDSAAVFTFDNATPVAQVITMVFSGIPVVGDTFKIGNKTYTWVASGATGDQINVGVSASASAANADTKIDTDTASTFVTSANTTTTNVLTANTAGRAVDYFSGSSVITFTNTTPNVSNYGYWTLVAANIGNFAPTAGTSLEIQIPILVGATTVNLRIGYRFQTSETVVQGIAGLRAVIAYLHGSGATLAGLQALHGYCGGMTLAQTYAQVSTALQGMFGSDATVAFQIFSTTISSDSLRFRLGTSGANGVYWQMISRCRESLAGVMPLTTNGAPNQPGWKPVGEFVGYKAGSLRNIIKYPTNNSDIESQVAGNSSASADSAIYAQLNLPVQELLSGNPFMQGEGYDLLALGGSSAADINNGRGYIYVFDGINGQFDYHWIYCGIAAVQNFQADINAVPSTPLVIAPQPFLDRPVDQYGQIFVYNEN